MEKYLDEALLGRDNSRTDCWILKAANEKGLSAKVIAVYSKCICQKNTPDTSPAQEIRTIPSRNTGCKWLIRAEQDVFENKLFL